jgi:pyruvate kinase
MRLTKIIATMGPACGSAECIRALIKGGLDVARLNFSHGTHDEHLAMLKTIRAAAKELGRPIAIMQDLCGPKIRVGELKSPSVELANGATIRIQKQAIAGDEKTISCTYPQIVDDVQAGDRILINDGLIELKAVSKTSDYVECRVVAGGTLKPHKGINLPGVKVSAPTLTAKDREDLEWGVEHKVDYIALSFVRHADDIKELKAVLRFRGADIHTVAKIEKPEAIEHIEEIVKATDVVMVARGDLGVEMRVEDVPTLQKRLINLCAKHNTPVIVATQMLESMIENAYPTRAEVSDIANAILDGTDAVMLSGETSVGKHPLKAFETMAHVAERTEESIRDVMPYERRMEIGDSRDFGDIIADAVAHLVNRLGVKAVMGFTASGRTARLLSKRRVSVPILGTSSREEVVRKMCMYRGVAPFLLEQFTDSERMFRRGAELAVNNGLAAKGDTVAFVAGVPLGSAATNSLRLERL